MVGEHNVRPILLIPIWFAILLVNSVAVAIACAEGSVQPPGMSYLFFCSLINYCCGSYPSSSREDLWISFMLNYI